MNPSVPCPECGAWLALPAMAAGQTAQCARCQHVFAPVKAPAPTPRPVERDYDDDRPPEREPLDMVFDPLRGEWRARAAVIMIALCLLSYASLLYVNFEHYQLLEAGPDPQLGGAVFLLGVGDGNAWGRRWQTWHEHARYAHNSHHLIFWPTMIVFLFWLHRAASNAWGLGATGMYFVPLTSVLSFFIPIVNLFWPCMTMLEIWRASHPRAVDPPDAWKQTSWSPLIVFWWVCFLSSTALAMFSYMLGPDDFGPVEDQHAAALLLCLSNLVTLFEGVLLILIIRGIMNRQRERHAFLSGDEEE